MRHKPFSAYSDIAGSSDAALASSLKKFLAHIDRVLEAVEEANRNSPGKWCFNYKDIVQAVLLQFTAHTE